MWIGAHADDAANATPNRRGRTTVLCRSPVGDLSDRGFVSPIPRSSEEVLWLP
jgi:hypothetical protein